MAPHGSQADGSRRRRRLLVSTGLGLAAALFVLSGTALHLAGRPVRGTEGLIAQQNMLMGVFQGFLGFAITMSTIYYAARTADMADAMSVSVQYDRRRELDTAVGNLIGDGLRVAA